MNPNRILTVVLAALALLFAILWLSKGGKAPPPPALAKEMWHTNTVELWRTNTIDRWHTNTIDRWFTNTVKAEATTKEVVKEVPVSLSADEKRAGAAGYRYLHAPMLSEGAEPFYKATPVGVNVWISEGAEDIYEEGTGAVKSEVEGILASHNIKVDPKAPCQLNLRLSVPWRSDRPRAAVCAVTVELSEPVAWQRQNDILRSSAVLWSKTSAKMIRVFDPGVEAKRVVNDAVEQFCKEYARAKSGEKDLQSKIPPIPATFQP